uniref:Small ribosomal subunit protein uS3m n=1 Tax=Trebouxia aggregata TaxID=160068 RepID=G8XP60_9CHLO|nr:ribosomal protein S3 [Trebouxia aggregata]
MGQKVNPISLRLEKTNRHFDSCWYEDYNYTDLLLQDLKIKNYFKTVLNQITYPEGRILIENLPKKSNINLFYWNPSLSRQKKKIRFQLQDYKDNKKSKKEKKKVQSFFLFPGQKYWNQEKNVIFTLAQQGLEGWKNSLTAPLHLYKKNVQLDKFSSFSSPSFLVEKSVNQKKAELLQSRKEIESISDLVQTKERSNKIETEKGCTSLVSRAAQGIQPTQPGLSPKGDQLPYSIIPRNKAKESKQEGAFLFQGIRSMLLKKNTYKEDVYNQEILKAYRRDNKKTKSDSKIEEIIQSNLGIDKQAVLLSTPYPSVDRHYVVKGKAFSYKQSNPFPRRDNHFCKNFTNSTSGMGDKNINKFLLQFILNCRDCNKLVGKQDTDNKWGRERFFVRYLLSQLYGKFLQNKSVSSQETLRLISIFKFFFHQKKKKQKPIIHSTRDSKTRLKSPNFEGKQHRSKKVQKQPNPQKGITQVNTYSPSEYIQRGLVKSFDFKRKAQEQLFSLAQQKHDTFYKSKILKKRVLPGLYSSNKVLKSHLESFLSNSYNSFFNLHLFRTLIEMQGALFLVQEIIYYLERKIPFRRIKTQILREIPHYKHIKGVRITCSGRVGGRSKKAQRSKTQSVKIGQTPLGVFSSKIDFASKSALTRFGLIGVKVWVCYR